MADATSTVTAATTSLTLAAIQQNGPLTRVQLSNLTNLSRPSVSKAVARLVGEGVVEEIRGGERATGGRPSSLFRLSSRRADTLGIELGRGHVAVAALGIQGAPLLTAAADVPHTSSVEQRAHEAADLLRREALSTEIELTSLRRVAVGVPGPKGRGLPTDPSNYWEIAARLERERTQAAKVLMDELGVPVVTGNNTRFTALGEAARREDAGAAPRELVYLRVDEGVGGGVVSQGHLLEGAWDTAGEMGHVSVDPDGPRCFCGGRGCLEVFASLPVLRDAAGAAHFSDLVELLEGGNARAQAALDVASRATAQVLSGVLAIANPRVVVLAGRVSELPGFFESVE